MQIRQTRDLNTVETTVSILWSKRHTHNQRFTRNEPDGHMFSVELSSIDVNPERARPTTSEFCFELYGEGSDLF